MTDCYFREKNLNEQICALQKQLDNKKVEIEQINKSHNEQLRRYAKLSLDL